MFTASLYAGTTTVSDVSGTSETDFRSLSCGATANTRHKPICRISRPALEATAASRRMTATLRISGSASGDQRRGSAFRTVMARPIHSTFCRSLMAAVSACSSARSTKAKPLFRPVSRSNGMEHLLTSPYSPNRWMRSSLSASQERFPMKMVKKLSQKGCTSTLSYQRVSPAALRTAKVGLPDAPLRHTLNR